MAQYFAGNSLAALFRTSTAVVEVTTAGRFDPLYTNLAISIPPNGEYAQTPLLPSAATGTSWIRLDYYHVAPTATVAPSMLQLMSGTTQVFRFSETSGNAFQPQYWNGSAWVNTGASFTLVTGTLYAIAIKIIHNSSFECYVSGTLVSSGSGWTGGSTSSNNIRFYGGSNTSSTFLSQAMWADYDIRDSKLMAAALNGNSAANTGGTGTYTDINETVLNEATAESITTAGNRMGQTKAAITVPGGYNIKGMVITARGRVSGAITNGKLGIRSGGVNYSSANVDFNGGYEPRCYISAVDPNTGTDFTQAGFNNAEPFFEAV